MINNKLVVHVFTWQIITGFIVLSAGCAGNLIGSSNIETKEMEYSDFSKVEVSSAFEVDISQGDTYFVSITANDNLFEHLDIRQNGRTLYIGLKQPRIYIRTTQKAAIIMPELDRLELSGASKGEVRGFHSNNPIEFEVSGASLLDIKDIEAGDSEFDISGASKFTGNIVATECDFNVSGASTVELIGSAGDVYIDASGASKVRLYNFPVKNVKVELSGASNGIINTSGQLDIDLSGASELSYIGNPTMGTVEISGGSTLTKK